jgi:DNA-binding FadR family transcriptional regulator
MTIQPIVRRKLSDEVRERLLSMIRSGEFQPGDRLPSERELMDQFGVGRPAIREALQSLGTAGLIEINHGERTRIVVPDTRNVLERMGETIQHLLQTSPTTLEQLREARMWFELGMIRTAAQTATPEDVTKLDQALDRQRKARHNIPEFIKADMAFHTAIAAVSRNTICVLLSEAMLEWLFRFRRDMVRVPGSEDIALAEHEQLVRAIAAHDVVAAETAMTEHMMRANERYKVLEEEMKQRMQKSGQVEP